MDQKEYFLFLQVYLSKMILLQFLGRIVELRGFSFSSSDFGILGDFSDFEYFDLNFLVIFGDSDLEVEDEFPGVFIFFSSKLFLKISICSMLFPTSSISIGIGSKIIV